MAADEQLDDRRPSRWATAWDAIGWAGRELLGDSAHAYMYAQRTADGRIAIGGRGVPYRFGSRMDDRGAHAATRTIDALWRLLRGMFPAAADVPVDHAWCGVLGVPRDWCADRHVDRATGLGWAGGYVGTGVATTNLAGRTLRDLVLREDTDADPPALGRPRGAPLGAGAAALDRRRGSCTTLYRAGRPPRERRAGRTSGTRGSPA